MFFCRGKEKTWEIRLEGRRKGRRSSVPFPVFVPEELVCSQRTSTVCGRDNRMNRRKDGWGRRSLWSVRNEVREQWERTMTGFLLRAENKTCGYWIWGCRRGLWIHACPWKAGASCWALQLGQSKELGKKIKRRSVVSTGDGKSGTGKAAIGILLQDWVGDWGIGSGEEKIFRQPTWFLRNIFNSKTHNKSINKEIEAEILA